MLFRKTCNRHNVTTVGNQTIGYEHVRTRICENVKNVLHWKVEKPSKDL